MFTLSRCHFGALRDARVRLLQLQLGEGSHQPQWDWTLPLWREGQAAALLLHMEEHLRHSVDRQAGLLAGRCQLLRQVDMDEWRDENLWRGQTCSYLPKVWDKFKFQSCTLSAVAYLILIPWEGLYNYFNIWVVCACSGPLPIDSWMIKSLWVPEPAQTAPPCFLREARASGGRLPLPFPVIWCVCVCVFGVLALFLILLVCASSLTGFTVFKNVFLINNINIHFSLHSGMHNHGLSTLQWYS